MFQTCSLNVACQFEWSMLSPSSLRESVTVLAGSPIVVATAFDNGRGMLSRT